MPALIHPWLLYAFSLGAFVGLLYLHQQSQLEPLNIYNILISFFLAFFAFLFFALPKIAHRCFSFFSKSNHSLTDKNILFFKFIHLIFAFFLGFFIYQQYGHFRAESILNQNIILAQKINKQVRAPLLTSFQIVGLPKFYSSGGQVLIQLYDDSMKETQPHRLILNWSHQSFFQKQKNDTPQIVNYLNKKLNFQPVVGEIYHEKLNIKAIHGFANPGNYDREQNYFQQRIQYSAELKTINLIQKRGFELQNISILIDYMRQKIRDILLSFFSTQNIQQSPIFLGLVLGDTSLIEQNEWQIFQKTGIAHLIAISGLHITLIFYLSQFLILPLLRRFPILYRYRAKYFYLNLFGFLVSGVYTLLSGLSIPAQRTFLMLCFAKFFQYAKFSLNISQILAWVMLLILLFDPWAVLSKGFLLSFLIVGLLIHFSNVQQTVILRDFSKNDKDDKDDKDDKEALKLNKLFLSLNTKFITKSYKIFINFSRQQWHLNAVLIPISIFIFSQLSIISPLMNLFAIPLITYIVTPAALFLSIFNILFSSLGIDFFDGFLAFTWKINDFFLNCLMTFASQAAEWKFASIDLHTPSYFLLISAILGIIFLINPHRARYLGLLFFLPFFYQKNKIEYGEFKMTALDVGQGTAIVLQTQNQTLVFDSGGRSGQQAIAEQTLIPFLKKQGISIIDNLIISHADLDHAGGFDALQKSFQIKHLYTSVARFLTQNDQQSYEVKNMHHLLFEKNQRQMQRMPCQPQTWESDGVIFSLLAPSIIQTAGEENVDSCVLKVFDAKQQYLSVLMTADIGFAEESALINQYQADVLKADILLVPHHGSRFSSDLNFIRAVSPQIAISQNGFLNRYKHPHPSIEARYLAENIYFYRTDYHGAIVVFKNDLKAYRLQEKRYWSFDVDDSARFSKNES